MNRFAFFMMTGVIALIGLTVMITTFQKCGWKALLLGNGAVYAAMTGMCDE
jgi:hypothetical protein